MKDKKWYTHWWIWLIAVVILVSIPIIINKCYLVGTKDGHANTAYTASDLLNFYGATLSFLGTILLGVLALWQNTKLNEINTHLQKTQMREHLGILFPKRMPDDYKEFAKLNPLLPLKCGGVIEGDKLYNDNANMLHISLENRGKDIIFSCFRAKSYINGKEMVETNLYKNGSNHPPLLIEIGESINYNYYIAEQNKNQIDAFDILTTFTMQNSSGIEYFQLLYVKVSRSKSDSTGFTITEYNTQVLFSTTELEQAASAYLDNI